MRQDRRVVCLYGIVVLLLAMGLLAHISFAEMNKKSNGCMQKAIERIIEIRSLPEKQYLPTLDGQSVVLNQFYIKCSKLYPQCNLFEKFYYLPSEIRQISSKSKAGMIKHKIRCYSNCLSAFCLENKDPKKIHRDVAEFYDGNGNFMGLSVYMGDGKYCALRYDGYQKVTNTQ
jgi:hypothetical protein